MLCIDGHKTSSSDNPLAIGTFHKLRIVVIRGNKDSRDDEDDGLLDVRICQENGRGGREPITEEAKVRQKLSKKEEKKHSVLHPSAQEEKSSHDQTDGKKPLRFQIFAFRVSLSTDYHIQFRPCCFPLPFLFFRLYVLHCSYASL